MAEDPIKKAEEAKRKLEEIREISGAIEEGFRELTSRLTDVVDEIKEGSDQLTSFNNITRDISRSIRGLSKINEDLIKNQIKLNQSKISSKDIDEQINKITASRSILSSRLESLQKKITEEGTSTAEQQSEILKLQTSLKEVSEEVVGEFKKQREEVEKYELAVKKANEKLGIFSGVLKGIGKIPIIGDLIDTKSALEAAQKATISTNSGLKGLQVGLKNIGGQFTKAITNPANVASFFIIQMVDALKKGDTATGDLAKDFNLTYNQASNVRNELIQIGNLSGNIALNARALQESMVAIGKALGSNAMLNQQDLEVFTELREMAGYTNEELVGIQKLTLATGGTLKNNTKQFLGTVSALNAQNKLIINEKQLLKEVANTSAAIKLSIGGTTKNLAQAAFQAKQFGINLDQADKIANSLLDFESSITAELEAELITGKDLNLERARLLALNGNIAEASAEILKQVKGSAEFTKMNRIQQESLAKAVGMSREELAASLIEREALAKIGVKDAAAAKAKFDLLVKEKGYAAAVAELGNEQYANQLKQQSIQERLNQSIEKLKEIFISLAEPILQIVSPFADLLIKILPPVMRALAPIIGTIQSIADAVAGLIQLIMGDFSGAMDSFKAIGPDFARGFKDWGMQSKTESSEIKFADGGLVTKPITNATVGEAGPEIIIPLTSPKVDKFLKQPEIDLTPLLNEIRALRQEQSKANTKPTIIENNVNGTRFGTAVAINTYKTQ